MSEQELRSPRSATRSETASTDRRLIAEYLEGHRAAFRRVDVWVRRELSARFPVLRHEQADVSQLTHEKLVLALRHEEFRHRSSLRTWVVRVTRYTAVDWLRRNHRDRFRAGSERLREAVSDEGPYQHLVSREISETLRNIVALAPRTCRELWRLAFVEGLGFRTIALRLSIPEGTVKSRMWYCRRRALQLLGRLHGKGSTFGDLV